MQLYRAKWNVQDSTGALVKPGGDARLNDTDAATLGDLGAIEREPIGEVPGPSAEERLAAVLALVPKLQVGDFTQAGGLRAEARRRFAGELGFEPSDDDMRAASEAYARAQSSSA